MIYVVSQYYPPISNPPANRMRYLVRMLTQRFGPDAVRMVTGRPNYPDGVLPAEYRWKVFRRRTGEWGETIDHLYETPAPFQGLYRKSLGLLSFAGSTFFYFLFRRFRAGDLVIVTTGPIFTVYVLAALSRLKRHVRLVVDVRDLWPHTVAAMGFIRQGSWLFRLLARWADASYRRALVTIGNADGWCRHLEAVTNGRPVHRVFNPVDTGLFRPLPAQDVAQFRKRNAKLFPEKRTTFLFAGVHAFNMDLMNLMQALRLVKESAHDFLCTFIGFGEAKPQMEAYVRDHDMDARVLFLPFMPQAELLKHICAVDFCFSTRVKDEVYEDFVPVKMLEYMACDKFVIAAHECRLTRTAADDGNALVCEAGDPEALADLIRTAIEHRDRYLHPKSARAYLEEHFSPEAFEKGMSSALSPLLEA